MMPAAAARQAARATRCGLVLLSLLGGASAQCTQPTTTGYDFGSVVETTLAQGLTFDVTGVACATGYTQAVGVLHVEASTCAGDGTPYVVSGCSMCAVNYVWDGDSCEPCAAGSTSDGPFGSPPMAASGAAATCTENTCPAQSAAEWAAAGCTVTDDTATTVTGLGALGEVDGFSGTCAVACDNVAFTVSGMTACTPLTECAGTTLCTTDATTGRTCTDCNAGFFPDDANNQCSACTPIAQCAGTTDCSTDATTDQTCDTCNTGYNPPDCAENTCQTWGVDGWATLGCVVDDITGTTVTAVGTCTVADGSFGTGTVLCNVEGGRFSVTGVGTCTPLEHCTGTTLCTTDEVTGRTCTACATGYVPDDVNNRCAPEHALDASLPEGYTGTMACTALHDANTCSGVSCATGYSTNTLRLQTDATTTLPPAGTAVDTSQCCEDNTGMCMNNRFGIGDFTCPTGYVPKMDADGNPIGATIPSDPTLDSARRTTACCDRVFCAASDCPATKVLLPDALTSLPAAGVAVSEAACCEDRAGMCSSNAVSGDDFTCPTGYAATAGSADVASASSDSDAARTAVCCDRIFCTEDFCLNPTKTLRPSAAISLPLAGVAASTLVCCEDRVGMCTGNADSADDYTCPTGYAALSDSHRIASLGTDSTADRTAACCERVFCAASDCSSTSTLLANAETTLPAAGQAASNVLCCENRAGMCGSNHGTVGNYVCPTGYTNKPNFEDIASPSGGDAATRTAECCDRVFCDESVCTNLVQAPDYHDADTQSHIGVGGEIGLTGCTLTLGLCSNDPSTFSSTYTVSPLGANNQAGDTMAGTCTPGHVGSAVATCGTDGQWAVTTECSKIADFCTNDPDTVASAFDVPAVSTDNEVGDTITGTPNAGFEGAATATCTPLSATEGAWVVTASSTVTTDFCGSSASIDTVASGFTLPTAATDNELDDTVTGVCADGYEGSASAVCAASANFEMIEQCTACPIGKAGTGGTCTTCTSGTFTAAAAQTSCGACSVCNADQATLIECRASADRTCQAAAGFSDAGACDVEACAATDPGEAGDVTICNAVVLDGHAATCTGAAGTTSGCTYTAGTYSRFNGAATCTPCTECDAATEETAAVCTTTSDRTCRKVAAHVPGAQASAAITSRLDTRSTDTSTQSSTKRASTRTAVAMDRARVFTKSNTLESDHASKLAGMRAKRSSMQVEIDAKVTQRVQTAANLNTEHATLLQQTNAAISSAQGRVNAAMAAKTAEATRVSGLRASQLEQHNTDTTLLAGQRDMFAQAAAAQQATLAATQGTGIPGVAQEVLDAENYVTTSQASAGYTELLATPGGAGRRLLGEL